VGACPQSRAQRSGRAPSGGSRFLAAWTSPGCLGGSCGCAGDAGVRDWSTGSRHSRQGVTGFGATIISEKSRFGLD
jgi:hypothetical protein